MQTALHPNIALALMAMAPPQCRQALASTALEEAARQTAQQQRAEQDRALQRQIQAAGPSQWLG